MKNEIREEELREKYGLISDVNIAICESENADKVIKIMK
jgi:hypothetical protein